MKTALKKRLEALKNKQKASILNTDESFLNDIFSKLDTETLREIAYGDNPEGTFQKVLKEYEHKQP